MKRDPEDPTTWTPGMRNVLRWTQREGGWYSNWDGAPSVAARQNVENLTDVMFQREHGIGESPYYEPLHSAGLHRLVTLAALLDDPTTLEVTTTSRRRMTPPTISTMPSKGRPKEIVRLSEETVAALVERAKAEGVSKSDIMRRAIEKELGIKSDG